MHIYLWEIILLQIEAAQKRGMTLMTRMFRVFQDRCLRKRERNTFSSALFIARYHLPSINLSSQGIILSWGIIIKSHLSSAWSPVSSLGGGFSNILLVSTPKIGEDFPIWRAYFFQMGSFNHQLDPLDPTKLLQKPSMTPWRPLCASVVGWFEVEAMQRWRRGRVGGGG